MQSHFRVSGIRFANQTLKSFPHFGS
jgi:hypothetical protein